MVILVKYLVFVDMWVVVLECNVLLMYVGKEFSSEKWLVILVRLLYFFVDGIIVIF